jgi:hypothetical protein
LFHNISSIHDRESQHQFDFEFLLVIYEPYVVHNNHDRSVDLHPFGISHPHMDRLIITGVIKRSGFEFHLCFPNSIHAWVGGSFDGLGGSLSLVDPCHSAGG